MNEVENVSHHVMGDTKTNTALSPCDNKNEQNEKNFRLVGKRNKLYLTSQHT